LVPVLSCSCLGTQCLDFRTERLRRDDDAVDQCRFEYYTDEDVPFLRRDGCLSYFHNLPNTKESDHISKFDGYVLHILYSWPEASPLLRKEPFSLYPLKELVAVLRSHVFTRSLYLPERNVDVALNAYPNNHKRMIKPTSLNLS
jgi:hypothetical protein